MKGSQMGCAAYSDSERSQKFEQPPAATWVPLLAVGLAALAALVGFFLAGTQPELSARWLHEGGPVESLSALALLAAALVLSPLLWREKMARGGYLPLLILMMGLRELDFDKRFTSAGVLQARLYSGDYPLVQQLIGAAIVLGLLALVVMALRHLLLLWRRGALRQLYPSMALTCLAWVVFAKILDGAARKLAVFGLSLPPEWSTKFAAWEELLEMLAAVTIYALAMKLIIGGRGQRKASDPRG